MHVCRQERAEDLFPTKVIQYTAAELRQLLPVIVKFYNSTRSVVTSSFYLIRHMQELERSFHAAAFMRLPESIQPCALAWLPSSSHHHVDSCKK
jgi:hypothetical protein